MKTITKSVIKLSELPEHLQISEVFNWHKIHTYAEFHIDDSEKDELTLWLIEKYPTIKMKVSFLIHIDIEKQEPKQETLEEVAEKLLKKHSDFKAEGFSEYQNGRFNGIIEGIKYQQERSYSKEEVLELLHKREQYLVETVGEFYQSNLEWFEQFKKK